MRRFSMLALFAVPLALATGRLIAQRPVLSSAGGAQDVTTVRATIVATGIPGAGAITEIGTFQRGGPFVEKPDFSGQTQPGQVLDPTRLLVASTSNFGAPLALPQSEGSVLSIDVSGPTPVTVPPAFAAIGGQAVAAGGAVILYTAQSPAFLNSIKNPGAVTSALTAVSLPLGISLNNGFGRVWFANAPNGAAGDGTISVIDPNGAPLSRCAQSDGWRRVCRERDEPQRRDHSWPDGRRARDGAADEVSGLIRQSGVLRGARRRQRRAGARRRKESTRSCRRARSRRLPTSAPTCRIDRRAAVTRVGMLFNWVPTRIALRHRSAGQSHSRGGHQRRRDRVCRPVFTASNQRYRPRCFDVPIDIAPAQPEVAARNFASNTTLGGGSDFYVLNRGNNSIVRMTQAGHVVAVRQIRRDVGVSG